MGVHHRNHGIMKQGSNDSSSKTAAPATHSCRWSVEMNAKDGKTGATKGEATDKSGPALAEVSRHPVS